MPANDNIYLPIRIATGDDTLSLLALIDTGAVHANYCSVKVATWVKNKQKQDTIKHNCKLSEEDSKVSTISILANSSNSIFSKALVLLILYFLMN